MKIECVTTFSQKGYKKYGKRFLDTYRKHWRVPLNVYYEGDRPYEAGDSEGVTWLPLDGDADRQVFLGKHSDKRHTDYRLNAVKFCHKVFALTAPELLEKDLDLLVWLDADIETHADVEPGFIQDLAPHGFRGSYLGRKDWHHSECGFMAFSKPMGGYELLNELRAAYTTGELFHYAEWHDSFIFDALRKRGGWWYNLSAGLPGVHVFDDSILGQKMRHLKGEQRKAGQLPDPKMMSQGEIAKIATSPGGGKMALQVKTKNCVPDGNIQANIHYSTTFKPEWVQQCGPHDATAIFCSAGPSLRDYLPQLRDLAADPNNYLVCVKHAHDLLISEGIIPWACILLDPRSHVLDFIETPHPDVRYFVASMCHPSTWDRLLERKARIVGYHAHVGAGEEQVLTSRMGQDTIMLGGGCSTAFRGISVLMALGFHRYKLFGYDLCYPTTEGLDLKEKASDGLDKYIEVEVLGKKFLTDAEKIAQAQNFETMVKQLGDTVELEAYGPGVIPHMWSFLRKNKPVMASLYGRVKGMQTPAPQGEISGGGLGTPGSQKSSK